MAWNGLPRSDACLVDSCTRRKPQGPKHPQIPSASGAGCRWLEWIGGQISRSDAATGPGLSSVDVRGTRSEFGRTTGRPHLLSHWMTCCGALIRTFPEGLITCNRLKNGPKAPVRTGKDRARMPIALARRGEIIECSRSARERLHTSSPPRPAGTIRNTSRI